MKRTQLTQPETLFDDDTFIDHKPDEDDIYDQEIAHIVDTQHVSYDDARRIHRLETDQYEMPETQDGASVELGMRALALTHIMATYGRLNQMMGANKSKEYEGVGINARYANPDQVREGMGINAARMIHKNKADLNALNNTQELIDAGFEPEEVEWQKRKIGKELLDRFGPGKIYAPERKKFIRRIQRVSTMVNEAVAKEKTT